MAQNIWHLRPTEEISVFLATAIWGVSKRILWNFKFSIWNKIDKIRNSFRHSFYTICVDIKNFKSEFSGPRNY